MSKLIIDPMNWTDDRKELIKKTYCKDATDLDLELFLATCQRLKLSPEAKQIYAVMRNSKDGKTMTIQVSIDGFRLVADRTGHYEGQTPVQWCGQDGIWKDIWTSKANPTASRVGVYKRGFREPLYATAHWEEYAQDYSSFWKKMPRLMLGKVAEALALRKAFPNELSGVYTSDEMPDEIEVKASSYPVKITAKVEAPSATLHERILKVTDAFKKYDISTADLETYFKKPIENWTDIELHESMLLGADFRDGKKDKETFLDHIALRDI